MLKNISQHPIGEKELALSKAQGWKDGRMEGWKLFSSFQSSNHISFSMLKPEESKGFTLIELTIVIALMMILYAIATPSLRNLAPSSRLKSSAREIQSLLTYARDVAMTENVAYLVVFDLDEQRYWLTSSENFDAGDTTSSLATSSLTTMPNFQQSTSVSEEGNSGQEFSSSRTVMIAGIPRKPATGVEIAAINITHDYSSYSSSTYSSTNPELSSAKSNARLRLSEGINSGAEVTTGAEYIYFTPKGTSEDMVLYLQDKTGKMMSVSVERETGQVSIRKESQNAMDSEYR